MENGGELNKNILPKNVPSSERITPNGWKRVYSKLLHISFILNMGIKLILLNYASFSFGECCIFDVMYPGITYKGTTNKPRRNILGEDQWNLLFTQRVPWLFPVWEEQLQFRRFSMAARLTRMPGSALMSPFKAWLLLWLRLGKAYPLVAVSFSLSYKNSSMLGGWE